MTTFEQKLLRERSQPLEPIATGVAPRLQPLPEIGVVLFDIYGTLLISGCGEIGMAATEDPGGALTSALKAAGLDVCGDQPLQVERLHQVIRAHQQRSREAGIEFPEVDILRVWRDTLESLRRDQLLSGADFDEPLLRRVAIEFETRMNPAWPMPGLVDCFAALHAQGILLGIVSNAQFFTPELFTGLVGQSLPQLGCEPDLVFFSYQHGQAKPGRYLYEQAARACHRRGFPAQRVLFVGNDMLNDVAAAAEVGLRTALFAGDERSLRLRENDPRVQGEVPDLIVSELKQIPAAICGPWE